MLRADIRHMRCGRMRSPFELYGPLTTDVVVYFPSHRRVPILANLTLPSVSMSSLAQRDGVGNDAVRRSCRPHVRLSDPGPINKSEISQPSSIRHDALSERSERYTLPSLRSRRPNGALSLLRIT